MNAKMHEGFLDSSGVPTMFQYVVSCCHGALGVCHLFGRCWLFVSPQGYSKNQLFLYSFYPNSSLSYVSLICKKLSVLVNAN